MSTIAIKLLQMPMLSEVLRFGREAFERSNYAPLKFNSVIARATLRDTLKDKSMRGFTAWRGERCVGLLIGSIVPLPWSAGLTATDIVFIADQGGDLLLQKFVEWAKHNRVVRIDMGVSDEGMRAGYDRFYAKAGFGRAGRLYYWQREVSA